MFLNYYKHEKINSHGDRIFLKNTKWPFYLLNVKNKKSLWYEIEKEIEKKCDKDDIEYDQIYNFLDKNPDIEFEIEFFMNEMPEIFFFKIENKMFCYTCDPYILEETPDKKVKVRFYFNYKELLNINS